MNVATPRLIPLRLKRFRIGSRLRSLRKFSGACFFGIALLHFQAFAQDETVRPALDPAAPLVESGDTPSSAIPIPPPIDSPAAATIESPSLIPADDNAPLPTEVPPVGSDGSSSASEGSQQPIQPLAPMTPLLAANSPVEPPIPPVLNNGKRVQFSLDVDAVYDDNIYFSSKNPVTDFIFVASPKLTLQRGDFRAREESFGILNYNPQAIFFAKSGADNTLDQNLKAEVQYTIARLAIGLESSYKHLSGATPDLGDRVERDEGAAKLRLAYGWGAKMEAESTFLYTTTQYDPKELADFSEFVNETFLRYQVSARTKAALGVGVGKLDVDGFGDQVFERALLQVISDVGAKFTLQAKAGVEFRQTDLEDDVTPIFSLAMDYRIREGTTLALEAYRDVTASGGAPGENLTRTGIAAKVSQRLGNRFIGNLAVGYEQNAYYATSKSTTAEAGRKDDYFFIRPSLLYQLREGRRFELYYTHREDDSNIPDSSFEANQVGASVGFDF